MINKASTNKETLFEIISEDEWQQMPPPQPSKVSTEWDEVLGLLEQGKIVQLRVKDQKDLKGKRILLGRRASTHGFRIESRVEGDRLALKKSDKPLEQKKPKTVKSSEKTQKQGEGEAEEE
jgi:hypothetical protein